jgi:hypothetical protein
MPNEQDHPVNTGTYIKPKTVRRAATIAGIIIIIVLAAGWIGACNMMKLQTAFIERHNIDHGLLNNHIEARFIEILGDLTEVDLKTTYPVRYFDAGGTEEWKERYYSIQSVVEILLKHNGLEIVASPEHNRESDELEIMKKEG